MPANTLEDARTLVQQYLQRMEARDLNAAQACLAEDAEIVFPGPFIARGVQDIVAYGKGRYQTIGKTYTTREAFQGVSRDEFRIIMSGTLFGTTLQGTTFEGVRFIDLFTVRGGRIVRQEVWNDLAESGVLRT